MLVRQSRNSFIRCTDKYGYINDQLTRQDRVYDETGAVFLKQIGRSPKTIDSIISSLQHEFSDVKEEELRIDFLEFIDSLEKGRFVVTGETIEELDQKDLDFTYFVDNPKTLIEDYTQQTQEYVPENTQDFFLEEVQGKPMISALQFELSSRCNERCIHCYIPNGKKDSGFDMPTEKIKSIIDEFAEMGGLHITLSGGEAFLHKDLMEICRYCREKDLKLSILSNLISLKDEQIPQLKALNISLIQTSLYSMDPDIHDNITLVKGSFEKTKKAIEKLVAADIPVQISCPLMKANKDGYRDVLEYARKLKINAQTDYIMMAQADLDTRNLANRLSLEETERVIRDIIEYDLDYKENVLMRKPRSEEIKFDKERFSHQPLCGVGYDNCCITVNGDVYPCAGWQKYVLGNVYQQSLKDIWENSEKIKQLRKITQSSFPQCLDCEAFDFCNRCLVRNFNESNGDMFSIPKHFCDIAFLNMRLVKEYEQKLKEGIYIS
jgi:radical SAM protein with 4Fe4S-binding SPASM domain